MLPRIANRTAPENLEHGVLFPRDIDIWAMPIGGAEGPIRKEFMSHPDRVPPPIYWFSHNGVPALSHASSESLKYYSLEFGITAAKAIGHATMTIFVNSEVDIICPMAKDVTDNTGRSDMLERFASEKTLLEGLPKIRHPAVYALVELSFLGVRHLALETLIFYIRPDINADGFHGLVRDQHIALVFEDAGPLPEMDWHEFEQ